MGLSSNQARFLSLTARQVDLENRVQQICQRRLRLASELERVATEYNNSISNRKMFTFNTQNSGVSDLSVASLKSLGLRVVNNATNKILGENFMKKINQMSESEAIAAGYTTIHDATELKNLINADLNGKYMLMGDIDMSSLGTLTNSLITGTFAGTFDGNGYDIRNLKIDTLGAATNRIGLFATTENATIKNVGIVNADVKADNSSYVSFLVGFNGRNNDNAVTSTIDNCYATGTASGLYWVGGLAGCNVGASVISNSYSDATITASQQGAGGIVGANCNGNAVVENCYSLGEMQAWENAGGIAGVNRNGNCVIQNSYSTADVTATRTGGSGAAGGITGENSGAALVLNSYSANCTITAQQNANGIAGTSSSPTATSTCFYYNNGMTSDPGGASNTINTTGWDTSVWDVSETLPTLKTTSSDFETSSLEERIRNGEYSIVKQADENTQSPLEIGDENYEKLDWRTLPQISDELYKSDDADAESKYDTTVANINAQDKKLQLEQSSVEVEYKAVASEKEAVKKILDTNATSSFKYFS